MVNEISALDFILQVIFLVPNSAQHVLPPWRWHLTSLFLHLSLKIRVNPAILRESLEHGFFHAVSVDDCFVEFFEAGTLGFRVLGILQQFPSLVPIELGQIECGRTKRLCIWILQEWIIAGVGWLVSPQRRLRIVGFLKTNSGPYVCTHLTFTSPSLLVKFGWTTNACKNRADKGRRWR